MSGRELSTASTSVNVHSMLSLAKNPLVSGHFKISLITAAADLKVFALSELSEILLEGVPRLAVNRLKLRMKVGVLESETSSRCTALVVQHVYRHSHTLEVLLWLDVFT